MTIKRRPGLLFILTCSLVLIADSCSSQLMNNELQFNEARENGVVANEGFRRCLDFTNAWLEYPDPASGLIPENLYGGIDNWNAHNSAADNYPFMVLTSITGRESQN